MANFDSITSERNKKWSYIPDHSYRILMIGGSKSGKINVLINLINEQNDIDKIYLYAKDLGEHEILIKQCKNVGIKHCNIQMHLLSVQIRWMTFMKILMITTQIEKEKS